MRCYSYDRVTGHYVSTTYADPDPMQPGAWLFPAFTTTKEPPIHVAGKVRVFNATTDEWEEHDAPREPTVGLPQLTGDDREVLMRLAVTRYANAVAVGQNFNSIDEAVSYADEPAVPLYQAQGRALRAWRSRLWFAFEQLLAQIKAGEVEQPTTDAALFELLPAFTQQDVEGAIAQLSGGDDGE